MVKSCVYFGSVMHMRLKPKRHFFRYKVFSLFLDIDKLVEFDKASWFFRLNKWGMISLYEKDHGDRGTLQLRNWVNKKLQSAGFTKPDKVYLLSFPRVLGFGFSPLSVFFCYSKNSLSSIIYEVKNTYGDQIEYIMDSQSDPDGRVRHSHEKDMYVSPFIDMAQTYHFTILPPDEKLFIRINEKDKDGLLLIASQTGTSKDFNDWTLTKAFFSYPFMLAKVLILIHWNALILYLKRVKIVPYSEARLKGGKEYE